LLRSSPRFASRSVTLCCDQHDWLPRSTTFRYVLLRSPTTKRDEKMCPRWSQSVAIVLHVLLRFGTFRYVLLRRPRSVTIRKWIGAIVVKFKFDLKSVPMPTMSPIQPRSVTLPHDHPDSTPRSVTFATMLWNRGHRGNRGQM